jgi:mono/diheme cytochrome c family protein
MTRAIRFCAVRMLGLLLLTAIPAAADSARRALPAQVPTAYANECAGCHLAYPPSLLPAASWQRLMQGLDRHFGSDASLDASTVRELSAWLQSHAATGRAATERPPEDRITRTAWFEREHRHIQPAVWRLPSVGSRANCAACHLDAAQGRFSDERLRMPAGLSPAQRQTWRD